MADNSSISGQRSVLGIFLLMFLALLALAAMWRATRKMRTEAAGAAQFQSLKSGDTARVALEVTKMNGERSFIGRLLEKLSETLYCRTQTLADVTFIDPRTEVAMGKVSDVRPGAIVYLTGAVRADRSVRAVQLAILTEYVTVK